MAMAGKILEQLAIRIFGSCNYDTATRVQRMTRNHQPRKTVNPNSTALAGRAAEAEKELRVSASEFVAVNKQEGRGIVGSYSCTRIHLGRKARKFWTKATVFVMTSTM